MHRVHGQPCNIEGRRRCCRALPGEGTGLSYLKGGSRRELHKVPRHPVSRPRLRSTPVLRFELDCIRFSHVCGVLTTSKVIRGLSLTPLPLPCSPSLRLHFLPPVLRPVQSRSLGDWFKSRGNYRALCTPFTYRTRISTLGVVWARGAHWDPSPRTPRTARCSSARPIAPAHASPLTPASLLAACLM